MAVSDPPGPPDAASIDEPIEAILVDTDDDEEPAPGPGSATSAAASSCS
jgi:hypothetical protein